VEYLSDKIRVVVTHQIQFIRKATQILVLSPEGRCLGLGSYDELQSQGIDFMAIVSDGEREDENDKQEREPIMRSFSQNSYDAKQTATPAETLPTESIDYRARRYSRSTSDVQTENVEVSDIMGDGEDYSHEPRIQAEKREVGAIGRHVYYEYVKAGAGPILFTITVISALVPQGTLHYSDLWLTKW
jgi:ATP-binding cassette subfamily C (CFTR/MRP) protein 4